MTDTWVSAGYVYGHDPASKNDYFGTTIHELPAFDMANPKAKVLPVLRKQIDATGFDGYDEMLNLLNEEIFPKYPPMYQVMDYTNEKTFTDLLVKMHGKSRMEKINFTNANKLMLKEDGLNIMKMGYEFPNPNYIANKVSAERVRNTIDQLLKEQVIITKSGKMTFDHMPGKHNDLAISWELSIHGCLKFILRKMSPGPAIIKTANPQWKGQKRPITEKDLLKDILSNPFNQVQDVQRTEPY